jgi:shikimate kinase
VAEIFTEEGEGGLRDWESLVIVQLARHFRGVLSLGGGAVLRPENVAALRPPGIFVWLQAPRETIAARVTSDPNTKDLRPQLTDRPALDEITHVLTQREPIYRQCADIIVDTRDKSPGQVVDEIVAALPKWDSEHDLSK